MRHAAVIITPIRMSLVISVPSPVFVAAFRR